MTVFDKVTQGLADYRRGVLSIWVFLELVSESTRGTVSIVFGQSTPECLRVRYHRRDYLRRLTIHDLYVTRNGAYLTGTDPHGKVVVKKVTRLFASKI